LRGACVGILQPRNLRKRRNLVGGIEAGREESVKSMPNIS
jgi:hypothetical protein